MMVLLCLLGFFGGQATVDGIENSELGLLDRRDGVVDGETSLPLQAIGAACGALDIVFVLLVGDVGLQVLMSSVIFAFMAAQFLVAVSFADLTS